MGHVAGMCNYSKILEMGQDPSKNKGKVATTSKPMWFSLDYNAKPSSSKPSVFNSIGYLAHLFWDAKETVPQPIHVPWKLRPNRGEKASSANVAVVYMALDPSAWKLGGSSSSCHTHPNAATVETEKNPPPVIQCISLSTQQAPSLSADMAYQRADPEPFIPENLQHEDIPNRTFMVRAVAPSRPPKRYEDLTIVTIEPLPGHALQFGAVRGVLRDLFHLEKHISYHDIHPTDRGQALVHLTHAYHRDILVQESPHPFDNIMITFHKHNEGRN